MLPGLGTDRATVHLVRIAELSSRSGTSIPSIKFYLREGLLPSGEATGATRARYDESHVLAPTSRSMDTISLSMYYSFF